MVKQFIAIVSYPVNLLASKDEVAFLTRMESELRNARNLLRSAILDERAKILRGDNG